jgi:membrane associated rhomboid family serine protease
LYGALIPSRVFLLGEGWRLVTYLFLHGSVLHLFLNMLALYVFGAELEQMWGTKKFVLFYVVSGVGAAIFSVITFTTPIIGASGAIMALLTMYAYHFPDRQLLLFFVFPVKVRTAVIIFGLFSLFASMGDNQGVAHLTHLGGIVVALAYIKIEPLYCRWHEGRVRIQQEKKRRAWVEGALARERYFDEVIDPLLQKISVGGMSALSAHEKKILRDMSKETREKIRSRNIVPFELFK